ncbi:MAG: DUF401 family protein [Spirochaetota bacterium]
MAVPIIVKLLTSLGAIILLNRLTRQLPLALLGGTLLFSFWMGFGVLQTAEIAAQRLFSWNSAGLIGLVSLVILLSMQMNETNMVEQLVSSVRSAFSPRTSLAVLPAVIGLLPMPGGALFSAPLLDNFNDLGGINPNSKTRINYWYRHVWEYAWPLYPGVIVACDVAGIELWQMLVFGLPMSAVAIALGYVFFLSKVQHAKRTHTGGRSFALRPFIPVLTVIVLYGVIQLLIPSVGQTNQYLPMILGLLAAITTLQVQRPLSLRNWAAMLTSSKIYKMLIIILMVRIYGAFIEAESAGISVVQAMATEMQQFGIPVLPLITALPFLAGLTMGVSLGFAGTALPVVVALLGVDPAFNVLMGTLIFSYVSGFMGTMLSPLHVCLIVTCEYYETNLASSFRSVVLPAMLMIVAAFTYMQLLSLLG